MATDNMALYGFRWAGMLDGSPGPQPTQPAFVATGYGATTAHLRRGDPLKMLDDGSVALATAGDNIDYIMAGVITYWDGTKMTIGPYLPYGTVWTTLERQARILVTPSQAGLWEIDGDDATLTTRALYNAAIGSNGNISINTDATGYYNNPRLDMSDISTNDTTPASAQCRIINISETFANVDYAGKYVKLIVKINESILALAGSGL